MKACAALSPSEISDLQSNQICIKTEATSVSQGLCNALLFTMSYFITFSSCFYDNIKLLMFPLTFLHFVVNESLLNQQSMYVGNIPPTTVKVVRFIKPIFFYISFH